MMTEKRLKAAVSQAVSYRNYRRARDRALTRLAQAYPDTYKELLEQEKVSDETEGRKWLDIDGNTAELDTRADVTASAGTQAHDTSKRESNNGGEA